jgi:predicted lipoprotein with Yx(FWY)xxD motif
MVMRTTSLPRFRFFSLVAVAAASAACGGSGSYGASSSQAAAPSAAVSGAPDTPYGSGVAGAPAVAATVAVGKAGSLGAILVDGTGRTLYLFEKDRGSSSCADQCPQVWPPLLSTGAAMAGSGASGGLIAETTRADGTHQVTYAGHPLYYYVADQGAQQTKGQGLNQFGADWYVLSAKGDKVDNG